MATLFRKAERISSTLIGGARYGAPLPLMSVSLLKVSSSPSCAAASAHFGTESGEKEWRRDRGIGGDSTMEGGGGEVPTEGISLPLSEILKQLNKRIPDSLIRVRNEGGFPIKYIPWHIANRIMNLHAPEWSGEVRSITYSADGKSVSVVYRVTIYGTDAEIYRESTGTASTEETGFGDPVQKAEAMAFRRACARFGLGLHLYHEDTA
ncbi:hypothetical protein Ancab_036328 [Ancistrocladus abbreviatus]